MKILRSLELEEFVLKEECNQFLSNGFVNPKYIAGKKQNEMLGYWLMSTMTK